MIKINVLNKEIGIFEQPNNPDFKPVEIDGFRKQSGMNVCILNFV
jgi:hypothetical protein